jgi:hypothetical protein
MTEIGATLRDARMRAKVDITDVELATKIRAKYLRALENEEWNLLPGPTFVKSFLRTYAEYLGLDARLLVEEYRGRYEAPAESESSPIGPPRRPERDRARGGPRGGPPVPPRAVLAVVLVLAVVGGLYALGTWKSGSSDVSKRTPAGRATSRRSRARPHHRVRPRPHRVSLARLQILPTGAVYVCLTDGKGRKLIPGATLGPGSPSRVFAAPKLLVTLGNDFARMRVDGRVLGVPPTGRPISYVVTSAGRRAVPLARGPRCG